MVRRKAEIADAGGKTRDKGLVQKVRIVNSLGLHARPSALFVQTANRFPKCRVFVSTGPERVNGKSIMGMMTLAAACGSELILEIAGEDAPGAMDALIRLIENKFEEE
jgi:phosphocarrier protein